MKKRPSYRQMRHQKLSWIMRILAGYKGTLGSQSWIIMELIKQIEPMDHYTEFTQLRTLRDMLKDLEQQTSAVEAYVRMLDCKMAPKS